MSGCPRMHDAAACALREMSAQEEAAYRAHLTSCTACRLKLAEYEETMDLLAAAPPSVAPPAGLKGKVMARVAAEAAARPDERRRRRWTLPVWAAAAAAFALMIGTYSLVRIQDLWEQVQQTAHIAQTVELVGTGEAAGARGQVEVAAENGGTRIALQAEGLPPLTGGEAYQLWLIKDGKRTSGGVFVVDASGKGGVVTWLPGQVSFDALGVSREPDAFGTQPRGPKMMGSSDREA